MRLNLGCGEFSAVGWLNVDSWPGVTPDVVADLRALPFPDGCATQVYAGHVLEHLDHPDGVRDALVEMRRVLADDGRMVVVTPDCAVSQQHDVLHGGHRWPGDEHRWQPTAHTLLEAVAGVFPDARPVDTTTLHDWPVVAHVPWQCAVTARRMP